MNRRSLLHTLGTAMTLASVTDARSFVRALGDTTTERMPVIFVGHGNPMNAITDTPFAKKWEAIGKGLTPRAILCISAHWETRGSQVTAMERPRTIHDFGGFPNELFRVQYPAPGDPSLATSIAEATHNAIITDHEWGLDHGAWSVLRRMFPAATIPVLQLSLDVGKSPEQHIALARELAYLRTKGVVIIGSGNIVHNLGRIMWKGGTHDWATEFDAVSKRLIEARDLTSLANYRSLGTAAQLSIPTAEHYLPMLYALSLVQPDEKLTFFNESIDLGSVSMRSFVAG
jgi:4,5-DOPA dioxygenase extradiol